MTESADSAGRATASGFATALGSLRQQLLDIGKRNRLIHAPVGKNRAKQVDIEDERSDEVFRILYREGKRMTFEPLRKSGTPADAAEKASGEIYLPPALADPRPPAPQHLDLKLQTRLTPEGLQKRLLSLYRDARTLEEEQGVSVLFLGLGFLRWYESESSELERFAPLILLPVDLERSSVRGRFRLVFRDQDLEPNLSLRAMLASDFDLALPDFPEGGAWRPSDYFRRVAAAVSPQPRWQVLPDTIELAFYSFARFLMWRDLAPDSGWADGAGGEGHDLLERVLVRGFGSSGSPLAGEENLDARFHPKELGHILDADTSQTRVIAAAREGRSLVVQGPPGTGKSQTIANIIAATAGDGKRVLFVAEKRAALEVVHRRLERCGLGPICLELHSHKANRKQVYADLKRTLELGAPQAVGDAAYERVRRVRDELNHLSDRLHRLDEPTGETPYGIIGRLALLQERGCPRAGFRIPGADRWSKDDLVRRRRAVTALASLTGEHGSESGHTWRGARRRVGGFARRRLEAGIEQALRRLAELERRFATAAGAAGLETAASLDAAEAAATHLDALRTAPEAVPGLLESAPILGQPDAALALAEKVRKLQRQRGALAEEVIPAALEMPWEEARFQVAARGESLFRWLSGPYRAAVARLRSVCLGSPPGDRDARLALLDRLLDCARQREAVRKSSALGRELLGSRWQEDETDLRHLLPALRWIAVKADRAGSGAALKRQLDAVPQDADLGQLAERLREAAARWLEVWEGIVSEIALDLPTAFGEDGIGAVPCAAIRRRLQAWKTGMDRLEGWHRLRTAADQAGELGLEAMRERLADGRLETDRAGEVLDLLRSEAVWERMVREEPALEEMDGADRSEKIRRFQRLDRELQVLASREVAIRHFRSLPTGSAGQVGIVLGEANKKTRHLRIRKLLERAGEAVARIKPVFLMSPLSVAQYLGPGSPTFDLLLMDEASQVRPADAIGAILRCRQMVVVGDQKQMPPTSFFDRQVSDVEEVDTESEEDIRAAQVGDMESILSLCDSRGMPGGMLRWHYRSRHPSLIAVSNHEFYDDGLVFPPSPDEAGTSSGLTLEHVEGLYDRGRRRNNPVEAEAIAEAVLAHAREHPEETLGVVALSVAQRDTIGNRLESLRAEFPELEAFCKEGKDEPFFVKNLENVQGDERDVVFISIGYGKDSGGYMSQSFGPVSREGGERRLNVLFTRARKKCRVFSSIRHRDIRLDTTKHAGPRILRRFLKFAGTGDLDIPVLTGGEPDSPFEEAVARALADHGYRVAGQVGSAGFLIDLAVYDPDHEGRFLLAVECDGARYHSSSWARERDRLRQAVLEGKGWRFHRIWSTDWFYNRDTELQKLLDAIERARMDRNPESSAAPPSGEPSAERPGEPPAERPVIRREEPDPERKPEPVRYEEASFTIANRDRVPIHEAAPQVLVEAVAKIVAVEGPIHLQETVRRLSRLWGYKRTGRRIREAVEGAAAQAVRQGKVRRASPDSRDFLDRTDGPGMAGSSGPQPGPAPRSGAWRCCLPPRSGPPSCGWSKPASPSGPPSARSRWHGCSATAPPAAP